MTQNPADWSELRERMARIIDPLAAKLDDELKRTAVLPAEDRPPETLVDNATRDCTARLTVARTKADELLALPEITRLRAGEGGEAKLPHDVDVGHIRFKAGVDLATFIAAARRWHARAALQSSPARVDGGWRPIETAPTDGTTFLGCWVLSDRAPIFGVVSWGQPDDREFSGDEKGWIENGLAVAGITHWMPLPPAPGETVLGSSGAPASSPADHDGIEGEPVAWRVKDFADSWVIFENKRQAHIHAIATGALIQPLYLRGAE